MADEKSDDKVKKISEVLPKEPPQEKPKPRPKKIRHTQGSDHVSLSVQFPEDRMVVDKRSLELILSDLAMLFEYIILSESLAREAMYAFRNMLEEIAVATQPAE